MGRNVESRVTNLRERVVERVRSEIVSGRTPAGTVYSVPALANELGMSTTPVREGLLELCRNGLLSPLRNRGFRVEGMSLGALDQLFEMRNLIERSAMESLARQGLQDPGSARAMADVVARAVDDGDIQAYIAGIVRFTRPWLRRWGIRCSPSSFCN
ncbi:GntR family transcriptional regulator [Diaphorobacter aerolatus]|uniref:GntR family transcriptional regulator n=1 Tax=Diaphorobacter aerolatus TaxID=1288495 RepID=UPI001D02644B|nr:GntR family transcriptional regulator [Diaphorobacter aerolatus]